VRFTTLSHAGLLVEHAGKTVLCDPWLIGSCHWRSWWNYPEPSRELIDSLRPDYIYLTHIHWDHFHGASLKLFSRDTCILVPKFPSRHMTIDLNHLGFHNIRQIPHAGRVDLAPGFSLHSYQFGIDHDSAVVLTDGTITLLNANDCKIFGLPLRQLRKRFPTFDFVLRSHSNARVLPYCLEDYEKYLPNFRTNQDYIEEFTNFCLSLNARYAIPFASNHCFLHRDTERFNDTMVRPPTIVEYYRRRAREIDSDSEIAIMPAGSSWSAEDGFALREFNYECPDVYIEQMKKKYARKLQQQYKLEENAIFNEEAFRSYFEKFIRAFPGILSRIKPLRITFKVQDRNVKHYWLVDFRDRLVKKVQENSPFEVMIEIPAKIMNDCTNGMFRVWGASKRGKVQLGHEKYLKHIQYFLTCLDYYENDIFPLWKNLTPRSLSARLRRWRELIEVLHVLIKHKALGKRLRVADLYLPAHRQHAG
jgi:UDP-MurNAc hydroxylase